jgi:PH and SEC7 domain-containing protein
MFRYGTSSSRTATLAPPSAYPGGSSPVTSSDILEDSRSVSRRGSRTDLDFEQVLKGSDTVKLREGPDLSLLGVTDSPITPKFKQPSTPSRDTHRYQQPPTPTVIPPTPKPGSSQGPATASFSNRTQLVGNELDIQTKRRSVLRAPGTASSPDLATLIRKAKEKTRAEPKVLNKDPPLNPQSSSTGLSSGSRPRSSTHNQGSHSPSSYRYAHYDTNYIIKGNETAPELASTYFSRTSSSQVSGSPRQSGKQF